MNPLKRNRNYEKYAEPVPKVTSRPIIKKEVNAACILQASTFDSLAYECSLLPLTKDNYTNIFINKKVDLLLIEAPSSEGIDEWNNLISKILTICKGKGIISVFWDTDKESIFNNTDLIKKFNYIFTISLSIS